MNESMHDVIGTKCIGLYYFRIYNDSSIPLSKTNNTVLFQIPSFSLDDLLDDPLDDACVLCGKEREDRKSIVSLACLFHFGWRQRGTFHTVLKANENAKW